MDVAVLMKATKSGRTIMNIGITVRKEAARVSF